MIVVQLFILFYFYLLEVILLDPMLGINREKYILFNILTPSARSYGCYAQNNINSFSAKKVVSRSQTYALITSGIKQIVIPSKQENKIPRNGASPCCIRSSMYIYARTKGSHNNNITRCFWVKQLPINNIVLEIVFEIIFN